MTIVVTFEYRFARTPDGAVWTQTAYGRKFFETHFLKHFDAVRIVSRVRDVEKLEGDWNRVDGPGISLHGLPYYIGPLGYLRNARRLGRAARSAVGPDDAVILRVPSQIANQLHSRPGLLQSALEKNSCQQRGVQSQTFQCTFNAADGPQSLIVVPEETGKVPHKKAEIEFFASKCVANCALPPDNSSAEKVNP